MKLEQQKIWIILFFSLLLGLVVFSCAYDPYAGKGVDDGVMGLILSRIGLAQFFGGF